MGEGDGRLTQVAQMRWSACLRDVRQFGYLVSERNLVRDVIISILFFF